MSFRPKPWYFERDCPVCTRSASSFCRNPLYSFAHAMRVKWWYHAKFQHFQNSFCSDFQFHGHFALYGKWLKNSKWCQKVLKIDDVALNGAQGTQMSRVVISFKKMKCQCNRWVLVRNPDTPKEIVQFVHEVRPVFAVTLSTLLQMLCGWIMIPCQVSTFSEFIL